jgi:Bacterial regulatory proteins, tetR family
MRFATMSRTGLTHNWVVTEAEEFAEEVGLSEVTFSALAARLGFQQPSLYRHIEVMDALQRKHLYLRPKRADRRSRSRGGRPISRRRPHAYVSSASPCEPRGSRQTHLATRQSAGHDATSSTPLGLCAQRYTAS